MILGELQALLESNFFPPATEGLDATFCLAIANETLTFRVREKNLEFTNTTSSLCDATFHFEDVDSADALLSGRQGVLESFMAGHFRADGYLMWAFLLMAMFRGTAPHRTS